MSHVAHVDESHCTHELCHVSLVKWAMLHMSMRCVTHVDESCRTCKRVLPCHVARANEHVSHAKWLTSMHYATWVMSQMWTHCVTRVNKWVLSHSEWMSHVTHVIGLCQKCEWIMPHVQKNHITHVDESCLAYKWVMSHMWINHVSHVNESCHTCEWVMSHTWMSHATHVIESCLTCEMRHVTQVNASCATHAT